MHIEDKISIFVKSQFPRFYDEEGPTFIEFVKTYYEWMEESGGVTHLSRELPHILDIDGTMDEFVTHFQKQYLYGVPEQVRGDKRFLIKHILDVYRSKGSIQGYKLLFRLLYNENIEIYLPSDDILRASDGIWKEPRYLEVSENDILPSLIGNIIQGSSSRAEAVVEEYIQQPVNDTIVHVLYISNVKGEFIRGEKILDSSEITSEALRHAPKILGSLDQIEITSGGQQFNIGDTVKIIVGNGIEGEARVASLANGTGTLAFTVEDSGSWFSLDAEDIITRPVPNSHPLAGRGASFNVSALANIQEVTYNTNIVGDFNNHTLNEANWGMDPIAVSNNSAVLGTIFDFVTKPFGSIAALGNIDTGNNYPQEPSVMVRDLIYSISLPGNVHYSNTSANVTGIGTSFTSRFTPGSFIRLVSDPGEDANVDIRIVRSVTNNTFLSIDDYPRWSSNGNITSIVINTSGTGYSNDDVVVATGSGSGANLKIITNASGTIADVRIVEGGSGYYTAPTLSITTSTGANATLTALVTASEFHLGIPTLQANFSPSTNPPTISANGSISGQNELITATPLYGTGIIQRVTVKNSGFNYTHGETVHMATYGALSSLTILDGGTGYSNGQAMVFSGGSPVAQAVGTIETDDAGSIVGMVITYQGSGYKTPPTINVISQGEGVRFESEIGGLNTQYRVSGIAYRGGLGKSKGYWTNTRGFLSDDKYIQDSYYYQEYSYEIQAPVALERYSDIVKKVFHVAGKEMFGRVVHLEEHDIELVEAYSSGGRSVINLELNSSLVGAVAGTPGTLPEGWEGLIRVPTGVTTTVTNVGVMEGKNFFDLRIVGTPTAINDFYNNDPLLNTVNLGDTFTSSIYFANVSGSANSFHIYAGTTFFDATFEPVEGQVSADLKPLLTNDLQRFSVTATAANVSSAFVESGVFFDYDLGVPINYTIRIAAPQLESGNTATEWVPT
jgi:hypothetical protein